MRIVYFICLLFIISNNSLAQSGKITGRVINANSGQALVNATLTLIEKSKTETADQNGSFTFNKLAPGTYSIRCSYSGHIEKIVEDIAVINNDNSVITISLQEKKLDELVVTVKTSARRETVASLLVAQKNMANVSDGISAESIRKTPDRSTSDVLKRVSGASIQDDRFAIIRGLNDRYNAAFINGAPLPSTESDRKAFAFDIFPSSILDNLVIYKTATPDKTGEFAGGIIDITTKSISPKSFTSISFGGSYNSLITGKNRFFSENKGEYDWLGKDDGTRALPAVLPSPKEFGDLGQTTAGIAQRAELAKLFGDYKWGIRHHNTSPNYNFQISKGFNVDRKQKEFVGVLLSVNYNRNFTFTEGDRNSFDANLDTPSNPILIHRGKYKDSVYNDEVVLAALGNISVKINNRHNISWKNNLSINTDNKFIKRIGNPDFDTDSINFVKDAVRWFTSNQIFSSQLAGEHQVGPVKTKINWLAAYSKVDRDIPNLSRTSYTGSYPDVSSLTASASSAGGVSQTAGNGTMFFVNSNENIKSAKIDITQPYSFLKNSQNYLKIGGGYQVRERGFKSRLLSFIRYDQNIQFDNSLVALPEDQLFLKENLGKLKNGKGGWGIVDATLPNSDYDASSATSHLYIMTEQRFFKKFRLIYGVRMETFNQKLNTIKNLRDTVNLDKTVTDFLPSVNFVYAVTPTMNLRLSYSKTVNRPEFREIAEFLFYDYVTNFSYNGLDEINRAKIVNYDFRYEIFPGKAQLFSVSAFYKKFTDPIEIIQIPYTTSQAIYYNSKSANVYGIETEFRVLVSTLFGQKSENSFLSKLTLTGNAAYIKSNVKLENFLGFPTSQIVIDRALQGQSPYIINTSLGYNDEKAGLSSTVSLNRVGDRILIAGAFNTADIYEKARTVIDFQLAKFFLKRTLELKFTARDILAQKINFYYDFDKTKSHTDKDKYFSSNNAPRGFSFSATIKL
jgi:TonB-dependent receptor